MAALAVVTVRLADHAEVKAALDEATATIARLRAECDEWESWYEDLLSACGGTWPA